MRRSPAVAALLDVALLLLFAAIGRRSHAEADALTGVFTTAWPFLAGAAIGWVVVAASHRRIPWSVRDGVVVWVATIVGGMSLRAVTGAGVAVSFIVVASLVTAIFLLGWRLVAAVVERRRGVASGRERVSSSDQRASR